MRVSDLWSLGIEYLTLGLLVVVFLGGIGVTAGIIYKKKCGNSKKLPIKQMAVYGVFLCYLVVVFGATTLSRAGFYEDVVRLRLFYSYRDAWNDFSMTEWRNIILNILMFVPLGFLLPFIHVKFRKAGWTYGAGLILTAVIEVVQLVLKRGIFEADDLLNNLVGTMIGYGIYSLCAAVYGKKPVNWIAVILYQIPLFIAITAFAAIFVAYDRQELGNLHSEYIVKQKIKHVTADLEFSKEEMSLPVYQVAIASVEETAKQAGDFFALFGDRLDEDSADVYENSVVYRSENSKSIWIEYKGSNYNYTDFELQFGDNAPAVDLQAKEEELRQALEMLGIKLPEGVTFELVGNEYVFTADLILQDGFLYDGTIKCKYTEADSIAGLRNSMVIGQPYKEFSVISQEEAFRRLEAGEFYYPNEEEWNIEIYDAYLAYEMDSKGFYQPVYRFDAIINANDGYIIIPAIEK